IAALTRIPGIGKKTAERMVLELRDKLEAFSAAAAAHAVSPIEEDVISALVNLGYHRPLVERTVAQLGATSGEPFDGLLRKTFAALAKEEPQRKTCSAVARNRSTVGWSMRRVRQPTLLISLLFLVLQVGADDKKNQKQSYQLKPDQTVALKSPVIVTAKQSCEN